MNEQQQSDVWTGISVANQFKIIARDTCDKIADAHNSALDAERQRHQETKRQLGMVVDWRDQLEATKQQLADEVQRREQAGNVLEHIDTVALAVSGFSKVANAISEARVILQ